MFCPICRAEFRPGFTRCTDCDVALVPSLPQAEGAFSDIEPMTARIPPSGRLEPLWEGDELALHTSLLEELDKSGIRYLDRALSNYPGVRRADYFPIQPMARFGYQVSVLSSELKCAREILEKLLDREPEDVSLPAQEVESSKAAARGIADDAQAISEVWSGRDAQMAGFLESALRENDIPTRVASFDEVTKIYVAPACESPAREIIREITEASPPQ